MKTRGRVAIAVFAALVIVVGAIVTRRVLGPSTSEPATPGPIINSDAPRAPEGVRIRVEVLNTTKVRGLARRATDYLRDLGYDVVEIGTEGPPRDTTLVIARTGHTEWAKPIAEALGKAAVENQPDTSRYVDVSVLLGTSWRPPAQPLYP